VGNFISVLDQISYAFQQCKNFGNRLRFDKVTDKGWELFLRHSVVRIHLEENGSQDTRVGGDVGRYHQGRLYVIDVSQSVEYDHPNALEFLRKDCVNVNTYFRRRLGVAVMTGKELFDFITDLSITDDNIDDYLTAAMKTASQRSPDDVSRLEADEEVNGNSQSSSFRSVL